MADPVGITFKGNPLTLSGSPPEVGQPMPAFTARRGLTPDTAFTQDSGRGSVRIVSVVPSLDTQVCSIQTRHFNEAADQVPGVEIVTVSADLPPAQQRWCGAEGVEKLTMVSDYYDGSFGKALGLRIEELGLLARAVFVLDGDGVVRYRQIVSEVTNEPDYEPALAAARELAGR